MGAPQTRIVQIIPAAARPGAKVGESLASYSLISFVLIFRALCFLFFLLSRAPSFSHSPVFLSVLSRCAAFSSSFSCYQALRLSLVPSCSFFDRSVSQERRSSFSVVFSSCRSLLTAVFPCCFLFLFLLQEPSLVHVERLSVLAAISAAQFACHRFSTAFLGLCCSCVPAYLGPAQSCSCCFSLFLLELSHGELLCFCGLSHLYFVCLFVIFSGVMFLNFWVFLCSRLIILYCSALSFTQFLVLFSFSGFCWDSLARLPRLARCLSWFLMNVKRTRNFQPLVLFLAVPVLRVS
jgi:hypothetical protein